jgi:hypothetical protein
LLVFTPAQSIDVAQSSGAVDGMKPWLGGLEAEHYGVKERRPLYTTRMDALPRKPQVVARQGEGAVLAELATPQGWLKGPFLFSIGSREFVAGLSDSDRRLITIFAVGRQTKLPPGSLTSTVA